MEGDGELFVTSKLGLSTWSLIDSEQRGERVTEQEDKGACASLPLRGAPSSWFSLSLPLPISGVYVMYTVLFK